MLFSPCFILFVHLKFIFCKQLFYKQVQWKNNAWWMQQTSLNKRSRIYFYPQESLRDLIKHLKRTLLLKHLWFTMQVSLFDKHTY